ncbi:hypothetical protein [Anthocerotibacter panamensis]|uniref:hypothetical protein n=1 Tax=Anthocerotibacter panamensis TaxID=2857077 RepID=UPI001C4079C9|nr:hypothetical protein [Anthocerotibacter panamensis]
MRPLNPEPQGGLSLTNFRKVCENGFGDLNNAYAHSMAWWEDRLYVGTTRANLALIKSGMKYVKIDCWPIECPYPVYTKEFEEQWARAEIWRYDPLTEFWERVFQSPMVMSNVGEPMARELGFRGMNVFQGTSDPRPVLYTSTWSRSRGPGPLILRSEDGRDFVPVSEPGIVGLPITSLRLLVPFKDRLFIAPSGAAKGMANASGVPLIFESKDPASGKWTVVNEMGFGDPTNLTIFEMLGFGDYLYAAAANLKGFQLWRAKIEGEPPYQWSLVLDKGAGRGPLNQGAASMRVFKDALYISTGIQNGGFDQLNKIGPAGAEIIRIHPDSSWDLIVGFPREGRIPLSGILPGFNSVFGGYIWKMGIHNDWLYAGTYDWTIFLRYTNFTTKPVRIFRLLEEVGTENIIENQAGFDLWRTSDGENWMPVTRNGFNNPYNYGIRNIVTTPHGVFIGTANPFGPKVARKISEDWEWEYVDNPQGGLEIWQGT